MDDDDIITSITRLVEEEHQLRHRGPNEEISDDDRERLESLEVRLDQCCDLLRQRRARRNAGQDPSLAHERPADVVEHYQQ